MPLDHDRRRFLAAAVVAVAGSGFARHAVAKRGVAQATTAGTAAEGTRMKRDPTSSFGPVKQIDAGLLDVGYVEAGPGNGHAVVLLHGWPYDIHTYAEVAPRLAAAGYRVIVPYLRGHGTTRFLESDTVRNGQQSAIALDVVTLMDALGIEQAILGGCDWGARTANIVAALWPERTRRWSRSAAI